ncbi:hypothetical protein BDV93DRAFT_474446, partial [Ceratobasidium sp. AG-I]
MSSRYNLRRTKRPLEGESSASNANTTSTNEEPLTESSATRNTKRARTGPTTPKASRKTSSDTKKRNNFGLIEVPIEIFTEIASLIHPKDLLSLARCCKKLRGMLMQSSAAHIWRLAESNVEGLPQRPGDISGAQYAALLFTTSCTSCGEKTSSQPDTFLRVRLCSECRETELMEAKLFWRGEHPELEIV